MSEFCVPLLFSKELGTVAPRYVRRLVRAFAVTTVCMVSSGCAILHHVQIGDIDSPPGYVKQPFDIKVSETGINLQEAAEIAKVFMNKKSGEAADNVAAFVGMFQMGPHTGNGVYVKDYAKNLVRVLYEKCPSGRVSGLVSVRETRKYPVVSGEIVKLTGYCLVPKEA